MAKNDGRAQGEQPGDDAERKVVRMIGLALPIGTVVVAAIVMALYGVGTGILVLAGGVLLGVVAIMWASVRTLSGDSPITLDEALALSAPSAAEEQKRAVLQALKDLEYERSVGKIAEGDYQDLLHRYRAEAKRLLRAVEEDLAPLRAKASAYVAEHLGTEEAPIKPKAESKAESKKAESKPAAKAAPACPSCQSENDADAVFCKKCGSKMSDGETKAAKTVEQGERGDA